MNERTLARLADAGMIGPILFGLTITVLTFLEYDFMVGIGWDPVESSDVPWPSGLALGEYGWFQVANFVFLGVCLAAFAFGLNGGVRTSGRGSWIGPALLVVAGIAMVLLGFKTDPSESATETWHGLIHSLAFLLLLLSLLPAPFFVWRRLRSDPRWRGYGLSSLVLGTLLPLLLFLPVLPGQVSFYLFIGMFLAWIEVMAIHLRRSSARRVSTAPDKGFRSARKWVLFASLALGIFALLVVPIHSAFIADPGALTHENYVWAACRLGNPLPLPEPICPRFFAGESPFTVLYALVIVPLLLIRGGARTMLTIAILSLTFALLQTLFADYPILPASPFPPDLNPHQLPSPFERAPATCGLVMCGLDHTLFHFAQMPFLLALAFFAYRAYQVVRKDAGSRCRTPTRKSGVLG